MSAIPKTPKGYNTVNPFIISKDAVEVMKFVVDVFDAVELKDALTYDNDGLVLHSEVKIGDSIIAIADRKKNWLFTPSFLQIYVSDIDSVLAKSKKHEVNIVTKPTIFLGMKFSRIQDKWGNLWWIYEYLTEPVWESSDNSETSWEPSPEAKYIYDTLMDTMDSLQKNSKKY